jgi:hypothetical protein
LNPFLTIGLPPLFYFASLPYELARLLWVNEGIQKYAIANAYGRDATAGVALANSWINAK